MKILILLILSFFSNIIIAQTSTTTGKLAGVYRFKDNSCSASFLFKANGEFYYEGGCEERSNIAKGHYKIDSEKITLTTIAMPLQYSINKKNHHKRREIKITITDADGKPLRNMKIFTLPYNVDSDTLKSISYLKTDSIGQLIIDSSGVSAISLDRFNPNSKSMSDLYHWESVSSFNSNKLTMQFNYPIFCLRYPQIGVTSFNIELQMISRVNILIDKQNNIYKKSPQ